MVATQDVKTTASLWLSVLREALTSLVKPEFQDAYAVEIAQHIFGISSEEAVEAVVGTFPRVIAYLRDVYEIDVLPLSDWYFIGIDKNLKPLRGTPVEQITNVERHAAKSVPGPGRPPIGFMRIPPGAKANVYVLAAREQATQMARAHYLGRERRLLEDFKSGRLDLDSVKKLHASLIAPDGISSEDRKLLSASSA